MGVSQFVSVSVVALVAAPTQPSFNIIGIAAYTTAISTLTKQYNSLTALQTDFPSGPVAAAATAVFSQNPNPGIVKVLKLTTQSTKTFTIAVNTNVNGQVYNVAVNGTNAPATGGATATLTATAIVTAVNALAITGVTAANGGGTLSTVTITGTLGTWYHVDVSNNPVDYLRINETTADPGMSTMLGAINAFDNNWYGLVTADHGTTFSLAIAAWVEANGKVHLPSCQDDGVLQSGSTTDLAYLVKSNAYNRSAVWYHQNPGQFLEAAIMGYMFTFTPGKANYFLKTVAGVTVTTLTDSQDANITAKNANVYRQQAGINVIYYGTMGSGRFIDIQTGLDYLTARLQTRIFTAMLNSVKIPYTDAGAAIIEGQIRAQLDEEIGIGFAADDSNLSVTVPSVASQAAADRAARVMRNVSFTFRAAGAIQSVIIQGVVTT